MLSIYYLVTTLKDETEFKRRGSDIRKCITLILKFSVNSRKDYDCC